MKQPNDFSVIHKIEKLLANEESLKKEQIECRRVAKNFTIEKNTKEILQLIEKVLKDEATH